VNEAVNEAWCGQGVAWGCACRYPYRRVYKADGVRIYHKAWWWCGCTLRYRLYSSSVLV